MIVGIPQIGIDLIEPERLQDRLGRSPGLDKELFTERELAYCRAQPRPQEHLAGRFCAKEATAKALGMDGFEPLEIEVVDGGEAAGLVLHGGAKAIADALCVEVTISISHLRGTAAAVALALSPELRATKGKPRRRPKT
jgi:holo-[acyl-carrier protein] synthase